MVCFKRKTFLKGAFNGKGTQPRGGAHRELGRSPKRGGRESQKSLRSCKKSFGGEVKRGFPKLAGGEGKKRSDKVFILHPGGV